MLWSLRQSKVFKRTLPFTLNLQESRSDRALCLQKSWGESTKEMQRDRKRKKIGKTGEERGGGGGKELQDTRREGKPRGHGTDFPPGHSGSISEDRPHRATDGCYISQRMD